jgi:hypothetical protein
MMSALSMGGNNVIQNMPNGIRIKSNSLGTYINTNVTYINVTTPVSVSSDSVSYN